MKRTQSILSAAAFVAALSTAPAAFGQVQPVSFESFDYPFPGLLGGAAGGTGWLNPWFDDQGNGVVVQANAPINPNNPFPWLPGPGGSGPDAVGIYSQQAIEFAGLYRMPDQAGHNDLTENGLFGKDGAVMWFTFTTKNLLNIQGDHYGGFSLFEQFVGEKLFMGSPWASNAWGFDPQVGPLMGGITAAGSDDMNSRTLVFRVDHAAGDERCRMWIDPPVPHPTTVTPDLDEMIPDFRWNEVRLSSGGALFYWDAVTIEKGEPVGAPIGTNYCGPAIPNTTGFPGTIEATGSTTVSLNNVTLTADQLPPNQFGYFLAGQTQGFFNPPGSSGIICLSGNIGRYNNAMDIIQGPTGSIALDLNSIPVNPPVAAMAGDTWYFQCWYRDSGTSNFTDGLEILFQ